MKMLKYTLFLWLSTVFFLDADAQTLLQKVYRPSFSEGKIKSYFKDIRKRTGVEISFSESVLNPKSNVKLNKAEYTVAQALDVILSGLPAKYTERPDKILIIPGSAMETETLPAETITLSGFIKDSLSSEVLIGATVYIPATGAGTFTNSYGFYSLTLPAGNYDMAVSYIGYKKTILSTRGGRKDIALVNDEGLEEISVVEKKEKPLDHIALTARGIGKYAAILGDNDVMRSLQHYPGVQQTADGSVGIIVRGGEPSQNLCLLDGVPLYYVDHFVSVSSVYNTEALKATEFYSGSFPSRYGGRLSSIIDVHTRDGDMEHFGGTVKLGLLSGSATLEGPLIKNKVSMIVSARRSWADLIWRAFDNTLGADFYDINAKINYQVNASNRIFLSVYNGRDQLRLTSDDEENDNTFNIRGRWGNRFIALKWNTVLSPKVFINTTATYSGFKYQLDQPDIYGPIDSTGKFSVVQGVSRIKDRSIRSQLFWYLSQKHKLELGLQYANAVFDPATSTYPDGSPRKINVIAAKTFYSHESVVYAEDEWKVSDKLKVRAGIHFAYWKNEDFSYPTLQPRLYASYKASPALTFYGSATRMAQFLHLLSNISLGFPTDFWLPSTANIKPEISTLGNAGFRAQPGGALSFGAEVYYKDQQNLTSYRGSSDIFDHTQNWEDRLTQGSGKSYGIECNVATQIGNVSVSLAYTLSKSDRKFERLNGGKAFPYRYDRRHNIHLDGVWQISKGISYTASWTFMNGEAITIPDQVYPDFDNNMLNNVQNYTLTYNYADWNNYRLPAIHRLDMAINFTKKKKQRYERTITLGIYNAYGRRNIVATLLVRDYDTGQLNLESYSVARFLPTISYRLQF